jgi:hypothetical protein
MFLLTVNHIILTGDAHDAMVGGRRRLIDPVCSSYRRLPPRAYTLGMYARQ